MIKQKFNTLFRVALLTLALASSARESLANPFYQGPDTIPSESAQREAAKVYLPNDYDPTSNRQWPVVMVLHGYSATGDLQEIYFGLRVRVSHRGFILVVPNGTVDSKGKHFWNATDFCCDFGHTNVDDVGYLTNLIRTVQAHYKVDTKRTYLLGHSNGGFMANRLACEAGEMFAGIASLAGEAFKNPDLCINKTPVSMLQIQAVNDPTINYNGTAAYPGSLETTHQWLTRNGCGSRSVRTQPLDLFASVPGVDTQPEYWSDCREGTEVALWTIRPYTSRLHMPHIPFPTLGFTEQVLDFLFSHHR